MVVRVAKHSSLTAILALNSVHDMEMITLSIKTAFPYGTLDEELCKRWPQGFVNSKRPEDMSLEEVKKYSTSTANVGQDIP